MTIVLAIIGVAVVMALIGTGLDCLVTKLSKDEAVKQDVNKTEEDK